MLNSNKLELSVERSQQGLVQITAMQEETAKNLTRLADRLDTFKVNTDQVEGKRGTDTDYLAAGASVGCKIRLFYYSRSTHFLLILFCFFPK